MFSPENLKNPHLEEKFKDYDSILGWPMTTRSVRLDNNDISVSLINHEAMLGQ